MENLDLPHYYVHRQKEFDEISKALTNYHLIIEGMPGVGKTTLVKLYSQQNPLNFTNVFYYNGYELELDESNLAAFLISRQNNFIISSQDNKRTLLIIDGFDEIISPSIKEKVLTILKIGQKYNVKLIITTRPLAFDTGFENNAYKMHLSGFTAAESQEFIKKIVPSEKINSNNFSNLSNLIISLASPLSLKLGLLLLRDGTISVDNLVAVISSPLNYKNELIEKASSNFQIISLDTPQIIQDVKIVNKSILERIGRNATAIYELTPRQFEEFVAELFEKKGYKVALTPETRDGGKDFLIIQNDVLGDFLIYAECKKYAPENPVGVKIVRELYGTVTHDKATAGIIVTSSYFSPEAKAFTERVRHQMSLVDFVKLNQWMSNLSGLT